MVFLREFSDSEKELADQSRLQLELELKRQLITDEVVVLQADSEKALRRTHGRYFEDLAGLSVLPVH